MAKKQQQTSDTEPQDDPFGFPGGGLANGSAQHVNEYVSYNNEGDVVAATVQVTPEGRTFDFSLENAPTQSAFPVPPEGVYYAIVTDFEVKNSSSGSPMVVITYQLLQNAEHPEVDTHDAKVWDYIVFTIGRIRDAFGALGLQLTGSYKANEIIGRQCLLQVRHDMYQGQKRLKIARYAPHPQGVGYRSASPSMGDIPF